MKNLINVNTLNYGEVFHNDNGEDYVVIGKNIEKDYTLLVKSSPKSTLLPFYVVAWGIRDGSWCQGHYFMSSLDKAVEFMKGGD